MTNNQHGQKSTQRASSTSIAVSVSTFFLRTLFLCLPTAYGILYIEISKAADWNMLYTPWVSVFLLLPWCCLCSLVLYGIISPLGGAKSAEIFSG